MSSGVFAALWLLKLGRDRDDAERKAAAERAEKRDAEKRALREKNPSPYIHEYPPRRRK